MHPNDHQRGSVRLFKTRLAKYINDGMKSHGYTYRKMEELSGVPQSTLSGYAKGKVEKPVDTHLDRIAAAFGDSPDVIRRMRTESLEETTAENMLVAKARDKELIEMMEEILRSSAIRIMAEHDESTRLQQTEIIAHADKLVEAAKTEASNQCNKVAEQCRIHEQEYKDHCNALLDAERRASAAELKGSTDMIRLLERNIAYLRTLVRNLSLVSGLLGAYSIYAYKTFDVADPSRGLYQGGFASNTLLIIMLVALLFVLLSIGKTFFSRKIFGSKQEQTPHS